ncbi:MAG: glycosyltransferase [Chloroflexi bacterium]|nr:glycosyltransferase [Chloroflexota bacterium]
MRALHVIPAVAERYGGPSHAIVGMGRALCQAGVEVLIATTDADGSADRLSVPVGETLSWHDVPTVMFRRQWSEAFKYSAPLSRWLHDNVGNYDVVHIHAVFSHACLAAASASRRRDVPYIVRPLGTLDPWSLHQKANRKRALWQFGGKRMLKGAAAVHYTTLAEQTLAETGLGLQRGVVIPLGVDDTLFEDASGEALQLCDGAPYVLVLGRLHPKKGLERFIDAFLEATEDSGLGRWRLAIAGDGEPAYVAGLRQSVQRHDTAAKVQFVGWLTGERKAAALREAQLLALPSHQENFGIVVAEALACGTPVLISEFVNLADEIRRAGAGWIVPLEHSAVVDALRQALRNDDARGVRGRAGRELARARFTWNSVGAQLAGLYSDLTRS